MYSNQAVHVQVCKWLHNITQEADFKTTEISCTVDQEIFMLKNNLCNKINVCGGKFSWFRSTHEMFLTVDVYNIDECLESSYYQVSIGRARCHWM